MVFPDTGAADLERLVLTDTCTIRSRPDDSEGTLDRVTGAITFPDQHEIYSGPCSFAARALQRSGVNTEIGEILLKLPRSGSEGVRAGQEVTWDTSANEDGPGLVFDVARVLLDSHQLTRRVIVRREVGLPTTAT